MKGQVKGVVLTLRLYYTWLRYCFYNDDKKKTIKVEINKNIKNI